MRGSLRPRRATPMADPKSFRSTATLAGVLVLAIIVVMLAALREATASPCKADGQTCRTSRSCCGTTGNNGLCVGGGSKLGFGICCTPNCTGKDCGDDGCGGSCGTCTSPAVCEASGTCCTPNCGSNTCGPFDGCGGSCGTCPAGEICLRGCIFGDGCGPATCVFDIPPG
jgi:hypothetical protein